ncbi:dimethyladenosine transferase 2, mitochondrial, partial [Asbolus verrucosus]
SRRKPKPAEKGVRQEPEISSKKIPASAKKSHTLRLSNFFDNNPHLLPVKKHIPEKYFALKRVTQPENLYLIDEQVAKKAAAYILPRIKQNENQIVCETNAGLGFITSYLLENGVKLVRLYESCPDFKVYLKDLFRSYRGRVELFTKDIFLLHRYDYIDKQDHGNRVEQLLKRVPKKNWMD